VEESGLILIDSSPEVKRKVLDEGEHSKVRNKFFGRAMETLKNTSEDEREDLKAGRKKMLGLTVSLASTVSTAIEKSDEDHLGIHIGNTLMVIPFKMLRLRSHFCSVQILAIWLSGLS
jgi:hypothetical protein